MMETLVVADHRIQYHSRVNRHGSLPSASFWESNCRSFESGAGILPTPIKSYDSPVTRHTSASSPITPFNASQYTTTTPLSKTSAKSTPIPIRTKTSRNGNLLDEVIYVKNLSFSELWAGPAYTNSPHPSSLPMPKFSTRSQGPQRSVSLGLPGKDDTDIGILRPLAKSAPASPTRAFSTTKKNLFKSVDSATETLRRILNLDFADE